MLHKYNESPMTNILKNVDVGFEKFFRSAWVRKLHYILITAVGCRKLRIVFVRGACAVGCTERNPSDNSGNKHSRY
jgi:hypothetical protein